MKKSTIFLGIIFNAFILFSPISLSENTENTEDLTSQALSAFQRGDFSHSTTLWEKSLILTEDISQQIDIAMQLAKAYQNLGMHRKVFEHLDKAAVLSEQIKDDTRQTLILGQMSDAWLSIGDAEEALELADDSVSLARELKNEAILAQLLNNQGNALAVLTDYSEAINCYQESIELSEKIADKSLYIRAMINKANALLIMGDLEQAKNDASKIYTQIKVLPDSHDKTFYFLSLGEMTYSWLEQNSYGESPLDEKWALNQTLESLNSAAQLAEQLKNFRMLSLSYGQLGQLYELAERYAEAQTLTRKAIFFAEQENYPEMLYRWHWQQGRIFNILGESDKAIDSYQRAARILKPFQNNIDVGYRSPPGSFDERVRPVYYELADLLLHKAESIKNFDKKQLILREARDVVESVKVAEIQNYFQDECVSALQEKAKNLEDISSKTAVLYPIPLDERLVLLVSFGQEIQQFIVPIDRESVNDSAWALRENLQIRSTNRFLYESQQLYEWLIRPLESELQKNHIDTLVVVPDEFLRVIPFSTLHDGKQFLVEKYALASIPGLMLTDPNPIQWDDSNVLLVGLSEGVQEYSPLPNVPKELETIQGITGGNRILNQEYSIENFRNQLKNNQYSVIHLATHGEFNADPEETYLLAYDSKLKIHQLQEIIGVGKFREKPLELLTLSACKTAAGDDKAALGLAGVAVRAGARSALATLWYVDDEATSITVTEFYRQMKTGISKAKALQNAQKKLIAQKRYWHPTYWAPFLLIGNWL